MAKKPKSDLEAAAFTNDDAARENFLKPCAGPGVRSVRIAATPIKTKSPRATGRRIVQDLLLRSLQ